MKWIITGAAGFIGSNTVVRLAERGDNVIGIDSLSRPGTEHNLAYLQETYPDAFEFVRADVRDSTSIYDSVARHDDARVVLHLAGQVAVTTSIRDPRDDFEVNALGTFNVCEAVRLAAPKALLLYASTNKVYGDVGDFVVRDGRWTDLDHPEGVPETQAIDLHSPYACSKGTGECYVLDYARVYGLTTASLRQSCIYGPRQFGIEDQGWVAWLTLAAMMDTPFTIFGDGRQVRDVLYVDDLVDCYIRCAESPASVRGRAINVGGGPNNQLSLLDLVADLERRLGRAPRHDYGEEREGDQRCYISDISRAHELLGWSPKTNVADGLAFLAEWLAEHLELVGEVVLRARAAVGSSSGD